MLQVRFLSRTSRVLVKCRRRTIHSATLLEELTERGFVQDVTHKTELESALATKPQTVYAGVDPTAPSLHIGHLVPLLALVHFRLHGHSVVPLIGSATGRIGDPSGRSTERVQQTDEHLKANISGLTRSVNAFFQRAVEHASTRLGLGDGKTALQGVHIKSNIDWFQDFSMIEFLRVVGVHARINTMMNRESVKARLSSQHGISFTEFTYQLLQAYDFYHLNKHHSCTVQVGGSDQWGNIVAGIELIGKLSPRSSPGLAASNSTGEGAFGITTPLLTTPSGEKFGKSAGNAVWLDENLTSVFDFYQYFLKSPDASMPTYLNLFTFLPRSDISKIVSSHNANPELRVAQKVLASEITEMVHGPAALDRAQTLTSLLFPTSSSTSSSTASDYSNLTTSAIVSAFGASDPRLVYLPKGELTASTPVFKLASRVGLVNSNSTAKALVSSRGLYLNNVAVPDLTSTVIESQLIDGRVVVLRAGKDKVKVIIAQ